MANGDVNYPELPPEEPPFGPPPPKIALGPSATNSLANPPAALDPVAQERIKTMQTQRQQLEAAGKREQEAFEEKKKVLAPYYQQQLAASNKLAATSEAQTAQLEQNLQPLPQYNAPDLRQAMGSWMMVAAAFGAIGNAFARGSTTASLTAFSGMLQGANKGSLEAVNQNYQTWEANAKQAEAYNRQALTKYKAIMDNAKLNWDVKSAQIKMIADQYQDDIMSSAAEQKNITAQMELYDKQERSAESIALRRQSVESAIKFRNEWYDRQKFAAEKTAVTAALRKDELAADGLATYEPIAGQQGKVLRNLIAKVSPSEYTDLNSFYQALAKKGGDKDVYNFRAALRLYNVEIARIVSNPNLTGVLTVTAQTEQAELLPPDVPPETIERVTRFFDQEISYRTALVERRRKFNEDRLHALGTNAAAPTYTPPEPPPLIPPGTETPGGDIEEVPIEGGG
jgi:hypothetical protein